MTNINLPKTAIKKLKKEHIPEVFILLTKAITNESNLANRVKIYGLKYASGDRNKIEFKSIFSYKKNNRVYKDCIIDLKAGKLTVQNLKEVIS